MVSEPALWDDKNDCKSLKVYLEVAKVKALSSMRWKRVVRTHVTFTRLSVVTVCTEVKVDGHISRVVTKVSSGISQGSAIGPLLFSLLQTTCLTIFTQISHSMLMTQSFLDLSNAQMIFKSCRPTSTR